MKIYLIYAVMLAVMCFMGLTHAASIQRIARNTEAIIPTIVEEILKVELQSDLKKNSAVEADDNAPVVKTVKEEIVVEPVASRTIEDGAVPIEDKKSETVEIVAVKEIIPEPMEAAIRDLNTQPIVEVVEKVEIVEKPVDNFRTESVPSIELPVAEIVKETVVIESVDELRKEPVAEIKITEEEIVNPMVRNIVKEEIPQVEELRNIEPVEKIAVKETIPEPVASANIVEPVVEIESQEKVFESVPEKKSAPVVSDVKEEKIVVLEEIVAEVPTPVVSEMKTVPEINPVAEIKEEVKPAIIEVIPSVEESDPQIRQDRPTIIQQAQQALQSFQGAIVNAVPAVGTIFNRNPEVSSDDAAAPAVVADESSTSTSTRPPGLAGIIQQVGANVQQGIQNVIQNINPANNNAAEAGETTARPNVLLTAVQNVQGFVSNVANALIPNRTTAAPASDEKPAEEAEKPTKTEDEKAVETEPQVVAVNDAVQKEEAQKVDHEEKENLVKN